jgi:curved DNA-binding protein CbpA
MDQLTGSLRERSLFEVIGRIRTGWRTGTLFVRTGEQARRFLFVEGDLFLPAGHALARQMGELLVAEERFLAEAAVAESEPRTPRHRPQLRKLVSRLAEHLSQLRDGDYSFEDGPPDDTVELAGPVWSTLLILEGAAAPAQEGSLLEALGAEDAIVVGRVEPEEARRLGLLGNELKALLEQLETPATLGELARRGGTAALQWIYRLRSTGLVTILETAHAKGGETARIAGGALAPALADKLSTRIAESLLTAAPQEEPAAQRHRVAELLSRFGSLDHYELLGITPLARDAEIHEGFERLGRLVHPANAPRLGWVGREGVLRLLFERAAAAYAVLSDPGRRSEYNREAGIRISQEVSPEQREKEVSELAHELFRRGSQHAEREEYFMAVELLRQAIALQPRAEYFRLLAQIQRRNPKWLRDAQESFRRAVKLAPEDTELRIELARLQERAGEAHAAKASYRAVLERKPGDVAAATALRRLERYAASGRATSARSGWLGRLWKALRGRAKG